MTPLELRDYILKHMSAEEALLKLLESSTTRYEKLKLQMEGEEAEQDFSPVMIVAAAAYDMGWDLALEKGNPDLPMRGMAIGTEEYFDDLFKKKE